MTTTNPQRLTIDELRKLVASGEASDPLVFLEALINGQDLRKSNAALVLAIEIQQLTGGEPSPEDWAEMMECLSANCPWQPVSLSDSIVAAKTLSEYLHPKRKQIDMTGVNAGADGIGKVPPLTEEEVMLFREKFDEYF